MKPTAVAEQRASRPNVGVSQDEYRLVVARRRERVRELHAAGLTQGQIAEQLASSQSTISRDFADLGLEARAANRPKKYDVEVPRTCGECGRPIQRSTGDIIVRGLGDRCDNCRRAAERVEVSCPECGSTRVKKRSRGHQTTCKACADRGRATIWSTGSTIARAVVHTAGGRVRQRWLGRWSMYDPQNRTLAIEAGINAGRAGGGRRSKLTPEQQVRILELDKLGWSTRDIAGAVLGEERLYLRVWRFLKR